MSERIESALKEVGAVLLRQKKHRVYQLPNGQKFTMAQTPSDYRAELNAVSELYKVAGVEKPKAVKSTKPRAEKPGRAEAAWNLPVNTGMAHALSRSGVAEAALSKRVQELENQLDFANERAKHFRMIWESAMNERDRLWESTWMRIGKFLRVVPSGTRTT